VELIQTFDIVPSLNTNAPVGFLET
jgi:hypothetical protein